MNQGELQIAAMNDYLLWAKTHDGYVAVRIPKPERDVRIVPSVGEALCDCQTANPTLDYAHVFFKFDDLFEIRGGRRPSVIGQRLDKQERSVAAQNRAREKKLNDATPRMFAEVVGEMEE